MYRRSMVRGVEQTTCLSHTHSESRPSLLRLPFRSSAQASGAQASGRRVPAFKPSMKTLINHFDFVFGDSALKPFKSASSGGVYFRVTRVPSDSDLDSDNKNSTKQHVSTVLAQVHEPHQQTPFLHHQNRLIPLVGAAQPSLDP
jgi:hypothetical protein